jgi:IS30 family transposase
LRAEGCSIRLISRTLSKDAATIRNALTRQRDAATAAHMAKKFEEAPR